MKKILLICFVLLFLGIDIVKADPYSEECAQCSFLISPDQINDCIKENCGVDPDPCNCDQYSQGTTAYFRCVDTCQANIDAGYVDAPSYNSKCANCSYLTSPAQVEECIRVNCLNLTVSNSYQKLLCGDTDVPYIAAQVTSTIITILKIATPVIIIIFGMIDLVKAVIAQKEDDISKGGKTFLKRTIIGVCVFLVFVFVQLIIGLVAPQDDNVNMWNCVDCFVNNNCSKVAK